MNPTCPQSARALGVLNNGGVDTNALGIFHLREGKGQSRQGGDWPGQQEAGSPILDIQGCQQYLLLPEKIRQTMGWGAVGGAAVSTAPVPHPPCSILFSWEKDGWNRHRV